MRNYDVLERLLQFLPVGDIVGLASIDREWRDTLAREMVWRRVVKREGVERKRDYLAKEYGDYIAEAEKAGLEPFCRSFFVTVYPSHWRKKWRSGMREKRYMGVPTELKKDITNCFDVCQDFVAIGTIFGKILVWRFFKEVCDLELLPGCLEQRIDKISIRHRKIIAVQNGLISVFSLKEGVFTFLYCKSFESPDRKFLDTSEHDFSKYSVAFISREQLSSSYKPLSPAKYPDQDFTVSATDREMFATARVGDNEVSLHDLETGTVINTFSLPQDQRVMKLAIVHLDHVSSFLYILTWKGDDKTSLQGMFYDMDTEEFIAHLHLHQQFDCHAGFFSLFTAHGLLSSLNSVEESDPLMFSFNFWNYLGGKDYSFSFYSDYGLCLAECRLRTLVTPRALNYFYRTSDRIIISQRGDKGSSIICYSGPGESSQLWSVSSSGEVSGSRSNALLDGSQAGGVVCTVSGAHTIQARDDQTGDQLWEETVKMEIENMWVGDQIIVTVPKNFEKRNTVCMLHVL